MQDDAPAAITTREMQGYSSLFEAAAVVQDDMRDLAARQARNHERLAAIFRDVAALTASGSLPPELDRVLHLHLAARTEAGELVDRHAEDMRE